MNLSSSLAAVNSIAASLRVPRFAVDLDAPYTVWVDGVAVANFEDEHAAYAHMNVLCGRGAEGVH